MRKVLVLLVVGWVGVSLAAAWVSVDRKLPYDLSFLDERGAADRIGDDWLYGWGTGLAAPMPFVAAMAVLAALSALTGAAGRAGAFLVALLGGLSLAYMLSSRPAHDRLTDTGADGTETALVFATLGLAGLLVLIGLTSWLTAPREPYH
ncbi:MAG: hypothetical protein ACRDWY_14150 [Actinomycetes bacterium]